MAIGFIAGIGCAYAVGLKYKLGFDDSFDVVGVHLVGGLVGTLLIGFFAWDGAPAAARGVFYGGGWSQLGIQAIAAVAVIAYSGIATAIIALIIKAVMGLRVEDDSEAAGVDEGEHAESGYDFSSLRSGGGFGSSHSTLSAPTQVTATAGKEG